NQADEFTALHFKIHAPESVHIHIAHEVSFAQPACRNDRRIHHEFYSCKTTLISHSVCAIAGQLHPVRSDRAPEDVVRRWLIRRLEGAEQAVPNRGADTEVHDLSMVMEVMESLETSQVGDAREVVAPMVLQVVHEGEIVVSGIQAEDEKGGDP